MISVNFFFSGKVITGFTISGHAGDEAGRDIVCAAVSSAAYLTLNTVTDVVYTNADISLKDGELRALDFADDEITQAILRGLELHLKTLAGDYPGKIKVKYYLRRSPNA